jgi:hypothetical protein
MSMAVASQTKQDMVVDRIGVEETRQKVQAGEALLVCAYSDSACKDKLLDGALLRTEFEAKLDAMPKDQLVIFYCG